MRDEENNADSQLPSSIGYLRRAFSELLAEVCLSYKIRTYPLFILTSSSSLKTDEQLKYHDLDICMITCLPNTKTGLAI